MKRVSHRSTSTAARRLRARLAVPALAILALAAPVSVAVAGPGDPIKGINCCWGVASGDVTPTRAVLLTKADVENEQIKVEGWTNPSLSGPKAFTGKTKTSAAKDFTVKIDVTGLQPGTRYFYRFKKDASVSDVGTFLTAPAPSTPADVRFDYTGDYDGTKVAGSPAYNPFDVLAPIVDDGARGETGINFWEANGDTIYSDSRFRASPATTLAEYRAAHAENRTYTNLKNLLQTVATYALMDDHEVVNDYAGQTVDPARYAAGRQAFLEAYPIRETGLPHDPSCAGDPLYRHFQWGSEVEIFLLDERSCRSTEALVACGGDLAPTLPTALRTTFPFSLFLSPTPPAGCLAAINNPARTLLGPVQKVKFFNDLLNSTAKWKMVASEDPIQQFHVLPYDRWEGYGAERSELLNFIQNNGIENVVFNTTDTHATLLNQVAIDNFSNPTPIANELVTGPVATDTFQTEVLAQAGAVGLFAVNQLLNLEGIDCRHLDKNSYAAVEASAGAGTATLTSNDKFGSTVFDQNTAVPCSATYGP